MARLQGSTGVEERGMHAWGFPRNLGGPIFSTDRNVVGEATTRNNPGPATRGVDPAGSEQQAHGWYFAAKATELRETGDGKSERSVVAARELETNLQSLLDRAKSGERYKAPPVRRVYIPKGDGSTRPLGIPTFEDKVLQRVVVMAMEPVYEHDFLDCSYGFRPGRSAHQALETGWKRLMDMGGGWVLEADLGGGIVKKRRWGISLTQAPPRCSVLGHGRLSSNGGRT